MHNATHKQAPKTLQEQSTWKISLTPYQEHAVTGKMTIVLKTKFHITTAFLKANKNFERMQTKYNKCQFLIIISSTYDSGERNAFGRRISYVPNQMRMRVVVSLSSFALSLVHTIFKLDTHNAWLIPRDYKTERPGLKAKGYVNHITK